ncbi:hypothetical protein [Ferrimonas pelagia]|uniref:Uncharacterized protein n=1 Tax=Ferrimonas pelagia TaxID=1177826 RepID=A0ABP9F6S7_9GAMM
MKILLVFLTFISVVLLYVAFLARKHRLRLRQDNDQAATTLDQIIAQTGEAPLLQAEGRRSGDQLQSGLREAYAAGYNVNGTAQQSQTPMYPFQQTDCEQLLADLRALLPHANAELQPKQLYRGVLSHAYQLGGHTYWHLRGSEKRADKGRQQLSQQRQALLAQLTKRAERG